MAENLKSKAWWLLLHTHRFTAQRRNPLTAGLVEEVDFFIPVIQCQHLQLFFSWETDTCFIAYLHSWIAETSNKQTCFSVSDRALRWEASQWRTLKAVHMAFFLPLHTSTSYLCDWASLITVWSLLAQARLLNSQSRFRGTRWILLACGALTSDQVLHREVSLPGCIPCTLLCQVGECCSNALNIITGGQWNQADGSFSPTV